MRVPLILLLFSIFLEGSVPCSVKCPSSPPPPPTPQRVSNSPTSNGKNLNVLLLVLGLVERFYETECEIDQEEEGDTATGGSAGATERGTPLHPSW